MQNATNELFISLMREYLLGGDGRMLLQGRESDGEMLSGLINLSKINEVGGIGYLMLRDTFGEGVSPLRDDFGNSVYQAARNTQGLEEIERAFLLSEIGFMPIKGTVTKELYPHPSLRTMGDIDVVILKKDEKKAEAVLLSLGYKKIASSCLESAFSNGFCEIDVHTALSNEEKTNEYFGKYIKASLKEPKKALPCKAFLLTYTIYHIAKHVTDGGCGIRPFMDVALLSKDFFEIDYLQKSLEEIGLLPFGKVVFALCQIWFGTQNLLGGQVSEHYNELTDDTLHGGIFGRGKNGGEVAFSAKLGKKTPLGRFFARLFPPYEIMLTFNYSKGLEGRKILLPYFWAKRLIISLKRKSGEEARKALREPFEKQNDIEKRTEYLKKWKLNIE